MSLLSQLIDEDYGLSVSGRWGRSDQHSSLVYDAEKDIFFFNSQDIVGDAYVYLREVRGWNHQNAKEYLRKNNYTTSFVHTIQDGEEVVTYPPLADTFHSNLMDGNKAYFTNRLITEETMIRFRLGYFNGFYTVPIYNDGLLRQIQMRRDSPKLISNWYKNVGPVLFNSDILRLTDEVYITEGLIGAILLAQFGIPAVAVNIGAEGFIPTFISKFVKCKQIYILYDNDKAGVQGAKKTASILGEYRCKIYTFTGEATAYAVDDYFLDGGTVDDLKERASKGKYAFELPKKPLTNNQ